MLCHKHTRSLLFARKETMAIDRCYDATGPPFSRVGVVHIFWGGVPVPPRRFGATPIYHTCLLSALAVRSWRLLCQWRANDLWPIGPKTRNPPQPHQPIEFFAHNSFDCRHRGSLAAITKTNYISPSYPPEGSHARALRPVTNHNPSPPLAGGHNLSRSERCLS
jgi:hypothetical protein